MLLEDNVYNRQTKPNQPKLRIWSNAGLMLTYRCPSRCACCYNFSGPGAGGPQLDMTPELALSCWRSIRKLAGDRGKVHLTGGEPFEVYDTLKSILKQARSEGLKGLQKVETNAHWCTDEKLVRDRLMELNSLGLTCLQISTDVYHQQYIPFERVRLAVQTAQSILGPDRVQVRWRDFYDHPVDFSALSVSQKKNIFLNEMKKHKERLLGRAAEELTSLLPAMDYENFANQPCAPAILGAKHVHIDGKGNTFPGTCVGIVVGNVLGAPTDSLDHLWCSFDYRSHPILSVLVEQGPVGLVNKARSFGYPLRSGGYAGKCHLCFDIRRYLYQTRQFGPFVGPAVSYGLPELGVSNTITYGVRN